MAEACQSPRWTTAQLPIYCGDATVRYHQMPPWQMGHMELLGRVACVAVRLHPQAPSVIVAPWAVNHHPQFRFAGSAPDCDDIDDDAADRDNAPAACSACSCCTI
ncbi:hypothetical protein TPAR_05388 [Tolypocladium paradoxum]|uniref:Uncharacterized protein n=1 Tax=Tolypocladium paradoxum TaxID=94208 RepID=A0A2S4KWD5_9HYPO|nr:hypothetical protein TPAR_05388 [Tolypocladium paradoxum]